MKKNQYRELKTKLIRENEKTTKTGGIIVYGGIQPQKPRNA